MPRRPSSRLIRFYRDVLDVMDEAGIPVLVGGAFALSHYAGIERDTKDLDLFLSPADCPRALDLARAAGYRTSVAAPHWLAKIHDGGDVVDLLYGSGNGLVPVDSAWFEHAVTATFDDRRIRLAPAEEMIWSKSFVMERHRYDGADIAHLMRARGGRMDWRRLIDRFGEHWPVLLSHVLLFLYVYPAERHAVPSWALEELASRVRPGGDGETARSQLCRGTFLSNFEYRRDIMLEGLRDARLKPEGPLTPNEIEIWNKHLGA